MKKVLFIDTNIYRYIFNEDGTFSDDTIEILTGLIDNNKVELLLPEQIVDEVERNYLEKGYNEELEERNKSFTDYKKQKEEAKKHLASYIKIIEQIDKEIKKEGKVYSKDIKSIETKYRNIKKSKFIQNGKKIKSKATLIKTKVEILENAQYRKLKRNPPFDKESKYGDAIIGESLLDYFKTKSTEDIKLFFLADDKNAGGQNGFNPFLENELTRINSKNKIEHRQSISQLENLFNIDISKIKEKEKEILKNKSIATFCNSNSGQSAGDNLRELNKYKKDLNLKDYEKVIKASSVNDQIYNSFSVNLSIILENESNKGYVIDIIENIDDDLGNNFKLKNNITLQRKKDQTNISQ